MNKRSREILVLLTRQESTFRIQELAKKFQVSERTIRNDINSINDYLLEQKIPLINLGSNGLILADKELKESDILADNHDLYTYRLSKEERRIAIAAILTQASGHIPMAKIADILYVSRATVISDLEGVRNYLEAFHLKVISHSNKGLLLEGKEEEKRKLLLQSKIPNLQLETSIKEENRLKIQKIINEQEHVHGRFLTDDSFDYLQEYLVIAVNRIRAGNLIIDTKRMESGKYHMAKDIMKYVSLYLDFEAGENEIYFLNSILDNLKYIKKNQRNQKIIGLQLITRRFIESISDGLKVDLNRDFDFYENLVNHLESVFSMTFTITRRDDFLQEISEKHPEVLRVVNEHIEILEKFVGREITEIEIDYIVIHVCAALERRKKKEIEFQVVIVCNGGVGTSQLLLAKMQNRFDFHVVDVVSAHDLKENSYEEIDMVVSTIPLTEYKGEYILVSPLFSDEDYLRVNRKIEELQRSDNKRLLEGEAKVTVSQADLLLKQLTPLVETPEKKHEITKIVKEFFGEAYEEKEPYLFELLQANNIQLDVECKDWKEAIVKSSKPLLEKGYIEPRYVDAMIKNVEENGTYIVLSKGFALPHEGFDRGCNQVGMNLIRLTHSVTIEDDDGEKEDVKLVCCMSAIDHKQHMKAFFHLVNMLTNQRFKDELLNAKTSKETADIIKRYELRIKE